MTSPTKITAVEPLPGHWLRLTFADGAIHEVDLDPVLAAGGVFEPIYDNRAVFESVGVDGEFGTVVWPGGVDLDPDVLRGDKQPASGVRLPRRVIQAA
jgi:hypothetical protein